MLLDPLHCYKKFIHAVGDHHRPRKNTRPLRTGTVQLLDLLVKAGGPAALIYKAGTDFYNIYKNSSIGRTPEPNIPKQNELRKMAGDLQECMRECQEKISDVDKKMDQMSLDNTELKGTQA
jgi:hypothetical protein